MSNRNNAKKAIELYDKLKGLRTARNYIKECRSFICSINDPASWTNGQFDIDAKYARRVGLKHFDGLIAEIEKELKILGFDPKAE